MKKYLIILLFALAGCVTPSYVLTPKYGMLLDVEPYKYAGRDDISFIWTIKTDEGDTIKRYLFKVEAEEPGVRVPYFDYKK